jgi:polyphosphate glucokinase
VVTTVGGGPTLVVDLGGTRVKAAVVDDGGSVGPPVVEPTPYPLDPGTLVGLVDGLAASLGRPAPVTLGFPGFVRGGRVITAPHFVTERGPGSPVRDDLVAAWDGAPLAGELEAALGCPALVANDAALHGAAVVEGRGLELVVTLGTGVGVALFSDGWLCPHLELAHHPLAGDETYNEHLGDAARRAVGDHAWGERVRAALVVLERLLRHDHLWLGGGNAERAGVADSERVTRIDPLAALAGGARLWSLPGVVGVAGPGADRRRSPC